MITIHAQHIPEPIPYHSMIFSGGEVHVRINSNRAFVQATLEAHLRQPADIMELLLVTDALRRRGCRTIDLIMPYIPYARQDRVCEDGEALSIKVFAALINAQNYNEVKVWDAHSDISVALIDRCINVHCAEFVKNVAVAFNTIYIAPDAGAYKKVMQVAAHFRRPCIQASKIRNTTTGEITGTEVHGVLHADHHYLIVDDICDGGRTFIELAKELKKSSAKVDLYVTHGIFSKGFAVFDGLIDTIYCANPWPYLFEAHNRIKV